MITTNKSPDLKVGPDGYGSYRYMIDGVISERFHNAASARHEGERVVEEIIRERIESLGGDNE